jgi:hypothetical protein
MIRRGSKQAPAAGNKNRFLKRLAGFITNLPAKHRYNTQLNLTRVLIFFIFNACDLPGKRLCY